MCLKNLYNVNIEKYTQGENKQAEITGKKGQRVEITGNYRKGFLLRETGYQWFREMSASEYATFLLLRHRTVALIRIILQVAKADWF